MAINFRIATLLLYTKVITSRSKPVASRGVMPENQPPRLRLK